MKQLLKKRIKVLLIISLSVIPIANGKAQSKSTKTKKSHITQTVPHNSGNKSYQSLSFALVKTKIDNKSCLVINKSCAVEIMPDTLWIKDQLKKMSEDDWIAIADDNFFYQSKAKDTLKKVKINVVNYDRNKTFIKFVKSNKTVFIIDAKKMIDAWGLILFNGKDNPVFWKSTDIDDALKDIYKK